MRNQEQYKKEKGALLEEFKDIAYECYNIENSDEQAVRIANFSFNMCLKMISEITDIDWEKVEWKEDTELSMVSYYSAILDTVRRFNKKDESNKTIVSKGIAFGTFKGITSSYKNLKFPKEGLKSEE